MGILRKILIGLGVVILCLGIYVVYLAMTTKSHSPAAIAHFAGDDVDIEVRYCRPYMKERLIFGTEDQGAVVPYGKKWRTGANEATQISLTDDVIIDGQKLTAGTYSLYCVPERDHWVIAFNERTDYWGAAFRKDPFDEDYDILRVKGEVAPLSEPVEQFGISLQQMSDSVVLLSFAWDRTQSSIAINL